MSELLPQKELAKLLNVTSGALTQARQQRRRVKGYRIDRWARTGPVPMCRLSPRGCQHMGPHSHATVAQLGSPPSNWTAGTGAKPR